MPEDCKWNFYKKLQIKKNQMANLKRAIFFILFWILISAAAVQAGAPKVPDWAASGHTDSLIRRGIQATILQRYRLATAIFDSLISENPIDPRGYFYKAAAIQSKMMDAEDYSESPQFVSTIRKAIDLSNRIVAEMPRDGWANFYLGSGYSYYAFFLIQKRSYFPGLKMAVKGVSFLEKAVQLDSTVYDAYLGIGTYQYWRSRKTKFLKWLPFFPDRTREGLRNIKRALEKSRYARAAALNELIWVEMDRHAWPEAIAYAREGLHEYPGSRFFLWPLAEAYFRAGQYRSAEREFSNLLNQYLAENLSNRYNAAVCAYKVAVSAYFDHDYVKSYKFCRKFFTLKNPPAYEERLKKKAKELRRLLKENRRILEKTNPAILGGKEMSR